MPLIVLSANRPYELLGTGANQTFEQLGYFGTQVRANISLGLATDLTAGRPGRAGRRSTPSGVRRPAGCWRRPPDLARPTPARCSSTSRCANRWCPTTTRDSSRAALLARRRPPGRQAVDLHPAGELRPAAGDRPHPGHRGDRRARRRRAPQPGRRCRRWPSPPRRFRGNPLHPLALRLVHPKQVIMLGRPTLHRPVLGAAGRSGGAGVRADHRPALARRVGQLDGHRHPRGDDRHPDPAWLARCAELNRHAVAAVREQLARRTP